MIFGLYNGQVFFIIFHVFHVLFYRTHNKFLLELENSFTFMITTAQDQTISQMNMKTFKIHGSYDIWTHYVL